MLIVKKLDTTEGGSIIFEVLTRTPFNGKSFELNRRDFSETFKSSANSMVNTNISNNKNDIYECINQLFIDKLLWWNYSINYIAPMYANVYESDSSTTASYRGLVEYKDEYDEKFDSDVFEFSKDFKFFRALFSTAKDREVKYEECI